MTGLAGRTVLVTRAREQAGSLVAALRARGAEPRCLPAIVTRANPDSAAADAAIAALGAYDWLVFTSPNAVRYFGERLGPAGRGLPAGLRIAAVGPGTAAALAGRGLAVAAIPAGFRGEALGTLPGLAGRRILLPCGDLARPETGAALRAAGATVDEVTVYRTDAVAPDGAAWQALAPPLHAVTFTSPSTVRGLLALLDAAGRRDALGQAVVACIGPTTTAAARTLGLEVGVEATPHTVESLVAALDTWFTEAATP